jgi:hypothetical protein
MDTIALLIKVLWSPAEAMAEIAKRPRILAPIILLMLFSILETGTLFTMLDPGQLRLEQWQRDGYADQISQADKEVLMQNARDDRLFTGVATAIRPLPIVTFISLLFFVCFSILGRAATFKSFWSVTAFAFVPTIVLSLAAMLTVLVLEPSLATLKLAYSFSPTVFLNSSAMSGLNYVVAAVVILDSIWVLSLLVIGYGFLVQSRVGVTLRVATVLGVFFFVFGMFRLLVSQYLVV